ncbi:NAD-dependent epimerase/dehydratase family protein [Rugosimonospora africana]|uniref:NAD-dependent dehydratase n=1 Tax=Rugosimonospora africana TaxID=556532 RepID=A0A8J3QQ37_9ACTN|nr:NAD(P)-dependent oxidoreductase [Rugosimonospora africana]GIH14416.1 NAD-dependent dehydratase [Rugosimonospora africana]
MTVLVTGAAGGVGRLLAPRLAEEFDLVLTDQVAAPGVIIGDLTDPGFRSEVLTGVDAVVHLAGDADPEHDWSRLRVPNADLVAGLLDAAVAAGVGRVVLASSAHAMAGHVDAGRIPVREDWPPSPCCQYGAVKVFAEALGRAYAASWGLRVICLRLGGVRERPVARSWLPGWLSPGDLGRLVGAALRADVEFGTYHGMSANTGSHWDLSRARAELGYVPLDDSIRYAGDVPDDLVAEPDPRARPRLGLAHRS